MLAVPAWEPQLNPLRTSVLIACHSRMLRTILTRLLRRRGFDAFELERDGTVKPPASAHIDVLVVDDRQFIAPADLLRAARARRSGSAVLAIGLGARVRWLDGEPPAQGPVNDETLIEALARVAPQR